MKIYKKIYPEGSVEIFLEEDGLLEIFYPRANYNEQENYEEALWIKKEFEKICKKYKDLDFLILIDLTKLGDGEALPDESMHLYKEIIKNKRIKKIATYGQTKWFAMIINVLMRLSRASKLKYFSEREQALNWLKNDK